MRNSVSCHVVADYFLLKVDPTEGDTISNLKLQKLCYYAQAWTLAHKGIPLFEEEIRAWAHGPVVRDLYDRFKKHGWQSIDPSDIITDPYSRLSDWDISLLDGVWDRYGKFSGRQLESLTHAEDPWKDAYGDRTRGERCDEIISHDAMKRYYRALLTNNGKNSGAAATA